MILDPHLAELDEQVTELRTLYEDRQAMMAGLGLTCPAVRQCDCPDCMASTPSHATSTGRQLGMDTQRVERAATLDAPPARQLGAVSSTQSEVIADCVPGSSFVPILFRDASTVRSNLGGQGGRCNQGPLPQGCDEQASTDPPDSSSLQEIYIRNVGTNVIGLEHTDGVPTNGRQIDMRITNLTEYRAWEPEWNGVKRVEPDDYSFAVINLLGPRKSDWAKHWNEVMTFTELRIEFLQRPSDEWDSTKSAREQTDLATPISLRRT